MFSLFGPPLTPFDVSMFFVVFGGTPGDLKSRVHFRSAGVGGRGGTQLIDVRNKTLITCDLDPCFRSATGASTCSLVGSSLEPAAGSTSPSASTRPREPFCLSFEGSGVIWALSGTWGLHCCTCAYTFAPYDTFVCLVVPLGAILLSLAAIWAPLGHPWGLSLAALASFWHPWGTICVIFCHFWPWTEKGLKKRRKRYQKESDLGAKRVVF